MPVPATELSAAISLRAGTMCRLWQRIHLVQVDAASRSSCSMYVARPAREFAPGKHVDVPQDAGCTLRLELHGHCKDADRPGETHVG